MGIEEMLNERAEKRGFEQGFKVGFEMGMEKGALEMMDKTFVKNLLLNTDLKIEKIASLVGVTVNFVENVKTQLQQ